MKNRSKEEEKELLKIMFPLGTVLTNTNIVPGCITPFGIGLKSEFVSTPSGKEWWVESAYEVRNNRVSDKYMGKYTIKSGDTYAQVVWYPEVQGLEEIRKVIYED